MNKVFSNILEKLFKLNKAVIVVYVLLIVGGIWSLFTLPTEFLPIIERPIVETVTEWDGASPSEVEKYITKPLEDTIYVMDDVYSITSTSERGVSTIYTQFNYGVDTDIKALTVQNELQSILQDLPGDLTTDPVTINGVEKESVISYFIYGDDLTKVSDYTENIFKRKMETVEGVGEVGVSGSITKEIHVSLDSDEMAKYDITINDIVDRIGQAHTYVPVGEIKTTENNLTILFDGKLENLYDIRDVIIKSSGRGNIYVKDIAKVEMSHKDLETILSVNGKSAVMVEILRKNGYDFIKLGEKVRETTEKLRYSMPVGITIEEGEVSADEIGVSVDVIKSNGSLGFVLAVVILFIFLKSIGAAAIIGLSIPISFIITFLVFKGLGISLNMLTLMGLALGVGMLVDNSVVVLDSIDSTISKKGKTKEAIMEGVSKVVAPITAATLTSIVVFIPVLLIGGMATELFKDMSAAIIISIATSLLVSVTFIPIVSELFLKNKEKKENKLLDKIKKLYEKILIAAMGKKAIILIMTLVMFIGSLSLMAFIEAEFMAESDEGYYGMSVETPRDFSLEKKERLTKKIDKHLAESEYTKWFQKNVETSGVLYMIALTDERDKDAMEVRDMMRDEIGTIPEAKINYFLDAGFDAEKDIEIAISSDNIELLKDNMDYILSEFSGIKGVVDITSTYWDMVPQINMTVNREALANYNLTEKELNDLLAVQINGIDATYLNSENDKVEVIVKLDKSERQSITDVREAYIDLPNGKKIKAAELADFTVKSELIKVSKDNRTKFFNFSANISEDVSEGAVEDALEDMMETMKVPEGINFKFIGEAEDEDEVMGTLGLSFVGAIGLIYLILVVQFNSFMLPLIIMGAIPMSMIGVISSLFVTGVDFDIMVMIGIIILSGVIVNNSLVLIEYIITLEKEGKNTLDACIEGGRERIRPILITTFTTVFGMLPMAIGLGQGSEIYQAMAIGLSSGLLLSTLLTLIVIPILYSLYRTYINRGYQKESQSISQKA